MGQAQGRDRLSLRDIHRRCAGQILGVLRAPLRIANAELERHAVGDGKMHGLRGLQTYWLAPKHIGAAGAVGAVEGDGDLGAGIAMQGDLCQRVVFVQPP